MPAMQRMLPSQDEQFLRRQKQTPQQRNEADEDDHGDDDRSDGIRGCAGNAGHDEGDGGRDEDGDAAQGVGADVRPGRAHVEID
eukprot:CAMPEP_0198127000 /NCGR_PEP_ID=MMETSP1442-20131203/46251_1 /TAXON_ID= /ORGANISM="Craspedostauros australis, Strain CCMP3328" /LENGTH=83 /DNA_ID=CAMNT_0043786903 /DNA_START=304 /DNA_END=552 /DNA_ORIENTATION=+